MPAVKEQPKSFGDMLKTERRKIGLPQVFDRHKRPWIEAPGVMVMPNVTGSLADTVHVYDQRPTSINEFLAVCALRKPNRHGQPCVVITGALSEQGQRFAEALDRHAAAKPTWHSTDPGFPDYWTC